MRKIADEIIKAAIAAAQPYENTVRLIKENITGDSVTVISIGKAAATMMQAAYDTLGNRIKTALLVTKYSHTGNFCEKDCEIIEAGHPVSDENSIRAAERGLEIAKSLSRNDELLVLLSGGGSSLFEKSKVSPELQRDITEKLLKRGADIRSINAVRKRLSLVKGGLLAAAAYPAIVKTIALSDVLSNDKSVIASGISVRDTESDDFVLEVCNKYLYDVPDSIIKELAVKNRVRIRDGGYYFAGDINILCEAAERRALELGFEAYDCTRKVTGEARVDSVRIIRSIPKQKGRYCFVFGGEMVVTVTGNGKGGRNQEAALAAAIELRGKKGIAFVSVGSDGTDGPTDAAGGFADGESYERMADQGIYPEEELDDNNSYFALNESGDLIITGATGTNVNDLIFVLTDDYEN